MIILMVAASKHNVETECHTQKQCQEKTMYRTLMQCVSVHVHNFLLYRFRCKASSVWFLYLHCDERVFPPHALFPLLLFIYTWAWSSWGFLPVNGQLFQASIACFGSVSGFCSAHGDDFHFRRLYINKVELNVVGNNREQHLLMTEIIKYVY